MTDFDKLREAAEEIKLDDLQKQRILEACKNKKRKKINYTAIAAVAAVLVITVAVFSPGFLMKAGAPMEMMKNDSAAENVILADREPNLFSDSEVQLENSIHSADENGNYKIADECTQIIFDAEGFRQIYSVIPQHFIALVDYDEFALWSSSVTAEDGMAIVQFAEHFGISKEAFDDANREYARYINSFYAASPLYTTPFKENEIYEIFNVELIFSADREAIDVYYTAFATSGNGDELLSGGSRPAEIIVPEEYYK